MTAATLSALLLLAAGLLQSFSLMCHRLPAARRPELYPHSDLGRIALNGAWLLLLVTGAVIAFRLDLRLGGVGLAIYFIVLPFVFQLPMARMLGFKNFRDYLDTVDRG